jgi:hypothetical protein
MQNMPTDTLEASLVTKHNAALNAARDLEHQAHVDKAIRDAIDTTHQQQQLAEANMRLPGDPWALRGIPAVGGRGSVGGAISGTRPDAIPFEHIRRKL